MKKWIWLFALPWTVTVSSDKAIVSYNGSASWIFMGPDRVNAADDVCASLNDAHNRRVNTAIEPIEKCVNECLGRSAKEQADTYRENVDTKN